MKKFSFLLLGVAALSMASCSQEELGNIANEGSGNYHITLQLPTEAAGTRAFGDGLTADVLHYALYDADNGNQYIGSYEKEFGNALETTVDFELVAGKSYTIIFFAQSKISDENGAYIFSGENHMFTVDYTAMNGSYNTDDYDCFTRVYQTGVIENTQVTQTIVLHRPVAQVNWGTNDLAKDIVTEAGAYGPDAKYLVSQVKTVAFTQYDFFYKANSGADAPLVGGVVGNPVNVTLTYLPRPEDETFPVEGYEYVSMQYLLVPASGVNIDPVLTISNMGYGADANPGVATTVEVKPTNVPVQGNFRTNIYGTLLTDQLQYEVVKEPAFNNPDYDVVLPQE